MEQLNALVGAQVWFKPAKSICESPGLVCDIPAHSCRHPGSLPEADVDKTGVKERLVLLLINSRNQVWTENMAGGSHHSLFKTTGQVLSHKLCKHNLTSRDVL